MLLLAPLFLNDSVNHNLIRLGWCQKGTEPVIRNHRLKLCPAGGSLRYYSDDKGNRIFTENESMCISVCTPNDLRLRDATKFSVHTVSSILRSSVLEYKCPAFLILTHPFPYCFYPCVDYWKYASSSALFPWEYRSILAADLLIMVSLLVLESCGKFTVSFLKGSLWQ